jgi:ferric-dicitrate binding protein FerR (iron transport regulator)
MNDDLLNKYLAGDTTFDERMEVYEWIKSSPENEDKFNSLRRIKDYSIWVDSNTSTKNRQRRNIFLTMVQIAALFVLFFGAYKLFNPLLTNENSSETLTADNLKSYNAPSGEYIQFTLEDGTNVWLNSKSTLTYDSLFSNNERVVKLEGEAFFDVASDINKPFKVHIGDYVVEVTGTEFNINSYDYFETSLISGSVTIKNEKSGNSIDLKPMESVREINSAFIVSHVNENDLLWKKGILSINDETIDEIIPILERYYEMQFIIENKNFDKNKKYTGKFRIEDGVEQILQILQIQNNISYRIEDDFIILN